MPGTTAEADRLSDLVAAADLATPMAIRVAATIRIADWIRDGLRDVPSLVEATGADPRALELLLNHLVTIGVLVREESGYGLSALGEGLCSDHPSGLCHRFDLNGSGHSALGVTELLHTVRTGESAYLRRFGQSFYDKCAADRDFANSFHAMMSRTHGGATRSVASEYDWGALTTVADVGGGDGTLLIELLRAHPTLRGTVVDMAAAVEAARKNIRAAGLEGRAEAVEASFFEKVPSAFGGYILSSVLPDWPDPDAVRILRTCARAAAPHGRVLVLKAAEKREAEPTSTAQALRLYALQGGRERSLAELDGLATAAGLHLGAVTDIGDRSIVELRPAAEQPAG
ncbi:methyltransferase [Streptomyces sp. NPDC058239]|uniref:methyltransferase n=1 Tax=unclassified Streptomyces TaxID=2593676 RepID=UPI00364E07A0